jgi:hypothetical protein
LDSFVELADVFRERFPAAPHRVHLHGTGVRNGLSLTAVRRAPAHRMMHKHAPHRRVRRGLRDQVGVESLSSRAGGSMGNGLRRKYQRPMV